MPTTDYTDNPRTQEWGTAADQFQTGLASVAPGVFSQAAKTFTATISSHNGTTVVYAYSGQSQILNGATVTTAGFATSGYNVTGGTVVAATATTFSLTNSTNTADTSVGSVTVTAGFLYTVEEDGAEEAPKASAEEETTPAEEEAEKASEGGSEASDDGTGSDPGVVPSSEEASKTEEA